MNFLNIKFINLNTSNVEPHSPKNMPDFYIYYDEYKLYAKEIYNSFDDDGLFFADLLNFANGKRDNSKTIRIYSNESVDIFDKNYNNGITHRPFIEVGFLFPYENERNLIFKKFLIRNIWIWNKGVERSEYVEGFKFIMIFKDLITLPLKLIPVTFVYKYYEKFINSKSTNGYFSIFKKDKNLYNINSNEIFDFNYKKNSDLLDRKVTSSKKHAQRFIRRQIKKREMKLFSESSGFFNYQNKVLELYTELKKILDNLNIKHWCHSGTVLGLLRHNDFIPWDDDIDIMVSYKEWKEKINLVLSCSEKTGNFLVDYLNINTDITSDLRIARFYSSSEETINHMGGLVTKFRPFIDIFFAAPSISFSSEKGWKKYERLSRMNWIYRKGFNRYQRRTENKTLSFKRNLKTYPAKLVYNEKRSYKYLNKPFLIEGDDNWNLLRRVDAYSSRETVWDLNKIIQKNVRGHLINVSSNYEQEVIDTFGDYWFVEKYQTAHALSFIHEKHNRNILTKKFIEEKIKANENN